MRIHLIKERKKISEEQKTLCGITVYYPKSARKKVETTNWIINSNCPKCILEHNNKSPFKIANVKMKGSIFVKNKKKK